jgi:hypothetical protein
MAFENGATGIKNFLESAMFAWAVSGAVRPVADVTTVKSSRCHPADWGFPKQSVPSAKTIILLLADLKQNCDLLTNSSESPNIKFNEN